MKEILISIVLGIIQGISEFLPVSSSGHLALFLDIFNVSENQLFLTVMLHLGTLLAVVVFYFKTLLNLLKKGNRKTIFYLFIATIPAGIFMILLKPLIDNLFSSTTFLWVGFFLTSIILWLTDKVGKKITAPRPLNLKMALSMGLGQAFAIFPGISRSGSTIASGIILANGEKTTVADFSFLMSIPIILGSFVVEVSTVDFSSINLLPTLLGVLSAFITGLFAIKFMLRLIKNCNFKWFSLYLIIIGLITFINSYIIQIF